MTVIITINENDLISDSRSVINTNFQNLLTGKLETSVLDTDITLAANSDLKVATQKATKAYIETKMTNPMTTLGDIIYGGASGLATRLAKGTDGQILTLASGVPSWADSPSGLPTQTGNSGKFLTTNGTIAYWLGISESNLTTSDVTTLDVSTSKHGFAPKAPNDITKFLRGDGSWAVPTSTNAPKIKFSCVFETLTRLVNSVSGAGSTSVDEKGLNIYTGATIEK